MLLSDPSVAAMTWTQWQMEYEALRAKERREVELIGATVRGLIKALHEELIGVLGLNLKKRRSHMKDGDDSTPFIPASLIMSNPELLKAALEEEERAEAADLALGDEAFERLSAALARGDMEPDDAPPPPPPKAGRRWQNENMRQRLAKLVKPGAPAHLASVAVPETALAVRADDAVAEETEPERKTLVRGEFL